MHTREIRIDMHDDNNQHHQRLASNTQIHSLTSTNSSWLCKLSISCSKISDYIKCIYIYLVRFLRFAVDRLDLQCLRQIGREFWRSTLRLVLIIEIFDKQARYDMAMGARWGFACSTVPVICWKESDSKWRSWMR